MRKVKAEQGRRLLCARFAALVQGSKISDAELGRFLGYSSSSTIGKVWKGEIFLDTERLVRFAMAKLHPGVRANLDWIFTGSGNPYLPVGVAGDAAVERAKVLSGALIRSHRSLCHNPRLRDLDPRDVGMNWRLLGLPRPEPEAEGVAVGLSRTVQTT